MIHPRIKAEFEKRKALLSNIHPIVVYDIPLLYEANMEELVDVVALVCLDKQKQIARIRERDNRTVEQIEQIIGYQMPQEEKKERAEFLNYLEPQPDEDEVHFSDPPDPDFTVLLQRLQEIETEEEISLEFQNEIDIKNNEEEATDAQVF